MKIGIFTDTYRPSVNGVVYVTEILRRTFEAAGHEVYIFAPAASLSSKSDDGHIIRFPAVKSLVTGGEDNFSLFFPPAVLSRIKELNFDILHFLVPGPVGLMALYAGRKLDIPVVAEHCTDYFEYVEHYPAAIIGISLLGMALPFTFKVSRSELLGMVKAGIPRVGLGNWSRSLVKNLLTVIHAHCDGVIVHSRKSLLLGKRPKTATGRTLSQQVLTPPKRHRCSSATGSKNNGALRQTTKCCCTLAA